MDTSINAPTKKMPAIKKSVWYESNAALSTGEAVCYNWDFTGDGATYAEARRYNHVETPSTTNAQHFAGVAVRAYSAVSGGQLIEIYVPGSVCYILCGKDTNTVVGVGLLTFDVTAGFKGEFRYTGLPGAGSAQPLQTTTGDASDPGKCMALLQEGPQSGGVEVVACATPGPTCMVGGTTLITGGNPGGGSAITLADGTIPGLRKKFGQITSELTTTSIVITVTTGATDDIDDVNLASVTFTHGNTTLDTEVTLEWGASWCVTGQTNAEPVLG